jgi:hypothetical protein
MRRPEALYEYLDIKGTPRIRKIRFPGKVFRWQSADWQGPSGRWYWRRGITDKQWEFSITGLYRLPEVVAALRVDVPVWWCEGEKDADSLASLGLTATTQPNAGEVWDGSAKWFMGFDSQSDVIIVCDNDPHGGWLGWERYTALLRVGVGENRISVVAPPWPVNDVTDVLEAGLSLDDLRPVGLRALEACHGRYGTARAATYVRSGSGSARPAPRKEDR